MNFNTKYILPGDDKDQIISKINQNFSQVYYSGVGLQGERGLVGATGIIGQVGRDGLTGPSGERANIWIFQEEPPGIYSSYPVPLENYDVWVNTSPTGSTGGPNRVYRFDSSYGGGDFGYFWIDTGNNFFSSGVLNLIQGISGPPEINSRNAIVAATGDTFVFSDDDVTTSNANPTYAKALISNRGFTTAELPLLSFGKTFYSATGAPAFIWQNNVDYSIQFSSNETLFIESQATGTYSSTGGTFGVVAGKNLVVNTSLTLGVTGPSGISFNAKSFGVSSSNFLSENFVSFPTQSGGFVVGATSSGNALTVESTSQSSNPGNLTVFDFSGGPSGGVLKPNVNLSRNGNSVFRINNASSGSYPTLSIGYTGATGSTGPSGGTGANIYKSYQTVTSPATSKGLFWSTPSSNYIEITPTNDVIRVVPQVPSGISISSNGRSGRIWISVTGISSYVESSNASEIDIFLDVNGMTSYSIGGIALQTNSSEYLGDSYEVMYIDDLWPSSIPPGISHGCRHVKITFFGSPFPSSVNVNISNRFAQVQAFIGESSGTFLASVEQLLPYSGPPIYSSGNFGPFTVICSELYRQGFMSEQTKEADEKFGEIMLRNKPEVMEGYHYWALPIVEMMKKSRSFSRAVWIVAKPWSDQMSYEMGYSKKGSLFGKILMEIGILFSGILGKIILWRKNKFLKKSWLF